MTDQKYIGGYQLISLIAEGGMGTIWKARHPHLDRWVAVKQIRADVRHDDAVQQAFIQEVQNLSKLHSPQILQVLDFGFNDSGEPYMVTEFLDGEDLAQRLKREHRLDLVDALYIGQEVLNALAEAHAIGLVHRDLKPGNIFLQRLAGERQDAVKVLDFGVAKLWESDRNVKVPLPSMGVKGSPRYMAPEQATMGQVTPATDIYSFGATMYRMLAGVDVFTGEPADVLRRQISEQPIPLRERAPMLELSAEVDDFVMVCLRKNRDERPASAAALGQRLQALLSEARAISSTHTPRQTIDRTDQSEAADQLPVWFESMGKVSAARSDDGDAETISDSAELMMTDRSERDGEIASQGEAIGDSGHPVLDYSKTVEEKRPTAGQLQRGVFGTDEQSLGRYVSSDANAQQRQIDPKAQQEPPPQLDEQPLKKNQPPALKRGYLVSLVVILVCLTVWIFFFSLSSKEPVASSPARADETDMSVRSVFEAIKSQTRADIGPPDDAPNIVKRLIAEKNVQKPSAMVLVKVAQGQSRFVRRKDGHVYCRNVAQCELPVDSTVVVYRRGFYPLKLEAMDLFDRRNNTWHVSLRKR